jgi:hypothetical protein
MFTTAPASVVTKWIKNRTVIDSECMEGYIEKNVTFSEKLDFSCPQNSTCCDEIKDSKLRTRTISDCFEPSGEMKGTCDGNN